jgi:starch synthase (maltosyl-transferring)
VTEVGRYRYTIEAWGDHFKSWREDLNKRIEAEQPVAMELKSGAEIVQRASQRAGGEDMTQLEARAKILGEADPTEGVPLGLSDRLYRQMMGYSDRRMSTTHPRELEIVADKIFVANFCTLAT